MRSQKDPHFSDLCDRVARNTITEEDEIFMRSRIQPTASENDNEYFKKGDLSIIVTVNKKRDLINQQKLDCLLPNVQEFVCDSVDRVTNLPNRSLPDKMKGNPGKTGNLQTQLSLKVGAPVIITTNHSKAKYKDDGIMNGARGFVQSIQTSKENPEKVEVVWIVFNKPDIGKRYRFEHNHLRKHHNPGHESATPILPVRNTFKDKFGNIEYQRTNFPLTLAYAITAHKCQGETLEEVIIDFGPDIELNIKNFILPGSFYVALTRVKEGRKLFLKSFDKSYIQVNQTIDEKVEAMKKFRPYTFKKVYLDKKIFQIDNKELKAGYLNINGLIDGQHADYLNEDHNLKCLDLLVLSETKLSNIIQTSTLNSKLSNWNIIKRYDSDDGLKHMGMLLLVGKNSSIIGQSIVVTHLPALRDGKLQIQGIIVRLKDDMQCGFIYCRSNPNNSEIRGIKKYFDECTFLMGDLNLSSRVVEDRGKINQLCEDKKISALKEITRSISNNQLDHILIDRKISEISFVTSYHNFISDHNSIIIRIGLGKNKFTDEFKELLTFDREYHMKYKILEDNTETASITSVDSETSTLNQSIHSSKSSNTSFPECDSKEEDLEQISSGQVFQRMFSNLDQTTCWLNSCLQLILNAMDQSDSRIMWTSELGLELTRLQESNVFPLNSMGIKHILVYTEDTRIATRISEIAMEGLSPMQLEARTLNVENLRLNLINGQQCVRDFFLCLEENVLSWPDVYSYFAFKLTHSSECLACHHIHNFETDQIYIELDVPQDGLSLDSCVEDYLCTSNLRGYNCESGCQKFNQFERRITVTNIDEAEFIIILLARGVENFDGYQFNTNKTVATNDIFIR